MSWTTETEPSTTWTSVTGTDFDDANSWRMSIDTDQHLLTTIAITELFVDPEDMDTNPEDLQAGRDDWTVEG